ncbi:hypothetical protein BJ508DRAFT_315188 [Ascobolus immersus RN42]|uniref:Uncharacterized protein n=1 Tax=Ascobolus immersus RN42 TaxID=1160509 RepID=A0A3N4HI47_ASCIM|nr:hypothetical protein BJ508DRAFT_315188 [Ascobolus immersus RN42]
MGMFSAYVPERDRATLRSCNQGRNQPNVPVNDNYASSTLKDSSEGLDDNGEACCPSFRVRAPRLDTSRSLPPREAEHGHEMHCLASVVDDKEEWYANGDVFCCRNLGSTIRSCNQKEKQPYVAVENNYASSAKDSSEGLTTSDIAAHDTRSSSETSGQDTRSSPKEEEHWQDTFGKWPRNSGTLMGMSSAVGTWTRYTKMLDGNGDASTSRLLTLAYDAHMQKAGRGTRSSSNSREQGTRSSPKPRDQATRGAVFALAASFLLHDNGDGCYTSWLKTSDTYTRSLPSKVDTRRKYELVT